MGTDVSRPPVTPGDLARLVLSSLHGIALTSMYGDEPPSRQLTALKHLLLSALQAGGSTRTAGPQAGAPDPGADP